MAYWDVEEEAVISRRVAPGIGSAFGRDRDWSLRKTALSRAPVGGAVVGCGGGGAPSSRPVKIRSQ